VKAFFSTCATPFHALMDPEGRRAWALVFLAGGGIALTTYAAFALYLVRAVPNFAFYLGLAGMVSTDIVLTGLAALLVKRTIKGSVLGNSFEISDDQAQAIAEKVIAGTPPPPPAAPASVIVQTGAQS
jgi:hypothetical protein